MALESLLPEIIVGSAALLILIFDTFAQGKHNSVAAALGGLGIAGGFVVSVFLLATGRTDASMFEGMLVVDEFALFFNIAVLIVAALVIVSSFEYIESFYPDAYKYMTEYVALLLFATFGMMLMASSRSLVTAFIALEVTSLPSYALVAFMKRDQASVEGGMKYFLLGALSSAILLYGISLVYGVTGTFDLVELGGMTSSSALLGMGMLFILFGFAFKIAAVPFQVWAPDAYTGAPTPIAGLISSASKIAGFVVLFRIFIVAFPTNVNWLLAVQILAIVTMTFGNFAAAVQSSVKRMLAYSSIGHAGYALIALAVFSSAAPDDSALALGAAMSHLLVYGLMNTGAFLVVALVDDYWGFGYEFEDYAGIARQVPVIGVAMGIFMFSLAGLPAGAGFVSKLVLFGSAVNSGFWWLALLGAINSALSLFYYTRVLKFMWVEEPDPNAPTIEKKPIGLYTAIIVAAVATVVLMFAFDPIITTATEAANLIIS
ncbi:MAG: NADH-quinone oxidoreductase subunit N [Halobacteria archaeon]|nr:NADH-quinone oxidoreductase subunit N [Halobacteria archaeon]